MAESKREGQRQSRDQEKDEKTETFETEGGVAVTRGVGAEPGPDVSNADIDVAAVSLDSRDSEVVENPDPNPMELRPAPGPSSIEVLGKPKDSG